MRAETFVRVAPASGLRRLLVQACAEQGFVAHVGVEATGPMGIRAFVAAGLGVALIAESAATAPGPLIEVHRLDPSPWYPPSGLITDPRRPPNPTLRAWMRHLEGVRPQG